MKIIAELGTNTGGDLTRALRMVDVAADCGCDGVKVQAYETADFLPEDHPDWAMFESNRLSWEQIEFVQKQTVQNGLLFGATPTSLDGIRRLAALRVDFLKNGSDYLLRHDMIDAMLATGIDTWVSTGMASEEEGDLQWLYDNYDRGARWMACTSAYPCPDEDANLFRLRWAEFDGYSDHTVGHAAAVAAAALGCRMLEKHFTLDHSLPGPDHEFSADPSEMAEIVRQVRRAEAMLGDGEQRVMPSERSNRDKWRVTVEQPLRG